MKLGFMDLVPQEASFKLESKPGKIFTLNKFSLKQQIWMHKRFETPERVAQIFRGLELGPIAEVVFHLLKDKSEFKDFDDFTDCISSPVDKLEVIKAMMATTGVSQPILDEIEKKELEKRAKEIESADPKS